MARYRGRHRAPSTTGRTIARTAVAGAAIGAPLLGLAPTAFAASDGTWDKVAQCESGGRWNVDTGNGYNGGLQFSPSTWMAYGGGQFSSSAANASREQQIVVAERVLAAQGWKAWPVCSKKAGAVGQSATLRSTPKAAPVAAPAAAPAAPTTGNYTVKNGDTLSSIANANGVKGGWKEIVAKNPSLAGNPDRIHAGQQLTL
jgi:resuscitation-promoting factor RpfA